MKYKKIIFLFALFLPVSIVLRLVQLSFTVDYKTGFFVKQFESNGEAMLWVVLALCFVPALFALISHRNPEKPTEPNVFLSTASFLMSTAVLYELFFEKFSNTVMSWQILAVKTTGMLTAVFFALYGLERFISFKLPRIFTAIPTLYFIFRIICDFTSISALALISENLLVMLAYCSVLLFLLQFAKLYNGLDTEYNFRKLLATGLASIVLCFTQTVPHIVLKLVTGYSFMHTSLATNINIFFVGIFIATFIFSHFSFANACLNSEQREERRISAKEKITKIYNKFKQK